MRLVGISGLRNSLRRFPGRRPPSSAASSRTPPPPPGAPRKGREDRRAAPEGREDRSSEPPLHVCHLVHRLELSGICGRVVTLCNGLDPKQLMASCLSLGPLDPLVLERMEPRVPVWGLAWGGEQEQAGRVARRAAEVLSRFQVDILHTHGARAFLVGATAGWLARVPLTVHTEYGPSSAQHPRVIAQLAMRLAGSGTCAFLAASEEVRQGMGRDYGVEADRVRLIPTGLDTEQFRAPHDREAQRRTFGFEQHDLVVGTLASCCSLRPPDHNRSVPVQEVVQRLRRDGLPARGIVVGHTPVQQEHMTYLAPRRDVPWVLGAMDVYLAPAAGLSPSLAVLEAMACSVPVVGPVEDERAGLLLPSDGAAAMAAAVALLARDPERRQRMGDLARQRVEREHQAAQMVAAQADIYQEMVASF